MTAISLLASSQDMKSNKANIALAKELSVSLDAIQIKELVDNLTNSDKNIQSDCIKTLYEVGYLKPELIADYTADFINLLTNRNNRLVWGAMIALATITDLRHNEIYASLEKIMKAIEKGSVITIDNGIEILARLNKHKQYVNRTEPLLIDQLWKCPIKQLPLYVEKALISINEMNGEIYQTIIKKRKPECKNDSQATRLERLLKQINSL